MALTTRTAARDPDRIREVFLSATAKDLADPRDRVQQALALVVASVFLQEEWASAAANAYALSIVRLASTDAYLGVFGYRYGWIPPGQQLSVTELECEEALRLWGMQTVPPIFLFVPEPGTDAATRLEAAAAEVLAEEYPADNASRDASRAKQHAFHERLRGSGRFINSFATLESLSQRAMASVSNWNVEILERAAAGPRTAVREIPPSALGAIDREAQRLGLETALLAVDDAADAGLCVGIHGAEDAGQFAFLSFLEQENLWNISDRPRAITPSLDRFDVASLIAAALAEIAPLRPSATATIEELAASLVDRSEHEPVVMFFAHLPRLAGGLEAFHQQFWAPLVTAARARRTIVAAPRRPFILVLPLSAPIPDPLPPMMQAGDAATTAFDFGRIILLPELERLTSGHVARWLEEVGVKSLKERRRIADKVTGDGVARGVFDRLNTDGFWPALRR